MKKSGRVLDLAALWDTIHRCLTEGELDPAAGDFPLNTAVLGGKQLLKGTDYTAVLIRPDVTRFIADALGELEEDDLRKKFFALKGGSYQQPIDEKHFMEMWLRWVLWNLTKGFSARRSGRFVGLAAPSPPEEIEVPTNSVPTVRPPRSSKSVSKSLAQLLWMSPAMTIGFSSRSAKNFKRR